MQRKPQSLFPTIPNERPVIDESRNFTPGWQLGFTLLFQTLNSNFKNEGIIFPNLDDNSIQFIKSLYQSYIGGTYNNLTTKLPDISGQTVFDTTNRYSKQFVIATDGASPPIVILAEWVPIGVMKQGSGNPNGLQAGLISWQYYDIIGQNLYICTQPGSTSTAVWKLII
jgi:hypothetical protein